MRKAHRLILSAILCVMTTASTTLFASAEGAASGGTSVESYVTSATLGKLRNDFSGFVGMKIFTGDQPVQVTSLGRMFVGGNTKKHLLKIVDAQTGTDVEGASVYVDSGTDGKFTYAELPSPVTLSPKRGYYIVTQETAGGDYWHDAASIKDTAAAACVSPVYCIGNTNNWVAGVSLDRSIFGPVDFRYVVPENAYTEVPIYTAVATEMAQKYPASENQGKVLILGDSYIAIWATSSVDMAPLETINFGMGGAQTGDISSLNDLLITPYKPSAIILYIGCNDIGFGALGKVAADRTEDYLTSIREDLPDVPIYYVSVVPTVARLSFRPQEVIFNDMLKEYCAENSNITFIDCAPDFYDGNGNLMTDVFISDNLHLNDKGYDIFAGAISFVVLKDMLNPTDHNTTSTTECITSGAKAKKTNPSTGGTIALAAVITALAASGTIIAVKRRKVR